MIDSNTFHIGDRVRLIYSRINEDILDVFSRELTDGDYDKYVPTGYVYSIHPEYIRLSNEPINKVPSWTGWISTAKYKYSYILFYKILEKAFRLDRKGSGGSSIN